METAARGILSSSERALFIALLSVGVVILLHAVYKRFHVVRLGRESRAGTPAGAVQRFRTLFTYVPGQWCNIRNLSSNDLAGLSHLAIFWGVVFFSVYTLVFFILDDGFGVTASLRGAALFRPFIYLTDIMGVVLFAGLASGVVRRAVIKPARLGPDFEVKTFSLIALAASLVLIGYFLLEGLRAHVGLSPVTGPVSSAFGMLFNDLSQDVQWKWLHALWWGNFSIILAFLVYVPYSHHQHALFSPPNLYWSHHRSRGNLALTDLEQEHLGGSRVEDFTWKQLLDLYGCAQCGRCQDACPAHASGKPLSPKKVIQSMAEVLNERGSLTPLWERGSEPGRPGHESMIEAVGEDAIWSCTTCKACLEACPVLVEQMDKVIEMRRHLVMMESKFPPEMEQMFRNLETYSDPWGMGLARRTEWAGGLNVRQLNEGERAEWVYWVGCAGAYDERYKGVAASLARILQASGIDFGILGTTERCCGDFARRMGNEYLFQELARENIEVLKKCGAKRIVTSCPHGYNVLKNEYPQLGGRFEVYHASELLLSLVRTGKLTFAGPPLDKRVAYHDSCYLGRYNGIYQVPREILSRIPGLTLVEAGRNREKGFCCGAGGGFLWMEERGRRINEMRAAELGALHADMVATACPFCLYMLQEGGRAGEATGESAQFLDLIEIVEGVMKNGGTR